MTNDTLFEEIQHLKKQKNAVVLAHTYQPGEVQDIADYVGDSYGLSVEATQVKADVIVFCGVRFMAETAAILSPEKTVILPEPKSGCPMADMITADQLQEIKQKYPDHLVMCYVNSTAEVKALSDICCTSSNALKIVQQLPEDQPILFVPDKYLGSWVQEQTGHPIKCWEGYCPTHVRILPEMIEDAKNEHPGAPVLIHPESPKENRDLCDAVLSTGQMCEYVKNSDQDTFIIATEVGILHTLKKQNPDKKFYSVDPQRVTCPNMKRGSVKSTLAALRGEGGEVITVDKNIADKAKKSLDKMLELSR